MKKISLVLVLVTCASTVVACGSKETVTIDVVGKWSEREADNFNLVLTAFTNSRGTKTVVRYHPVEHDIGQELRERAQNVDASYDKGGPPDVAILPQTGTMNELAEINALVPVEDVAGELVDNNYTPLWRQLGTLNGKLYGVWFKANNKSVFWYRSQVFQDARVTPPRDWKELQEVATTLAAGGKTPFSVGGADGWTLTDWFENVYLRTAGGENYTKLACREILFDDQTVKDALRTLAQIFGRQGWVAGGGDIVSISYENSVDQVFARTPRAAMLSSADYAAGQIRARGMRIGAEARFFDFPSIDSQPSLLLGGDVAVLLRHGETEDEKKKNAGRDLIRFLATPEAAEPWAKEGGFVSPNKSLEETLIPNDIAPLAKAVQEAGVTNEARYDLSDQFPPAFGSTDRKGMYQIFQDYVGDPTNKVESTAAKLEEQASVVNKPRCR